MGWDRHKLLWDGNGTDKYAHGQPCEYTSGLTSTPKAELFCSCKRRKFIGQNKAKF